MTTRETLTAGDGAESAEEMDRQTRDREAALDDAVAYLTDTDPLYHQPGVTVQTCVAGHTPDCASQRGVRAGPHGAIRWGECDCRPQPSATGNVAPSAAAASAQADALPAAVEALLVSPYFRTVHRGYAMEVAEIERAWLNRLRAAIAAALDERQRLADQMERAWFALNDSLNAERAAREAAERELRRIARWVGAEPNEATFDAVARCRTAREVAEHRLATAERERDEADRRAGTAERQLETARHRERREDGWLYQAKRDRGYDPAVNFDVVWAETCAKADRSDAAEARVRELEAALRRIVAGGDGDPYGIAEEVLAARAAGGADA